MRIIVIGGSGHIGTFLIPRLIAAGHDVVNISRGESKPYQATDVWKSVQTVNLDRTAEEASGSFAQKIAALKPDVVIDLICYQFNSIVPLVEALKGQVSHFLQCGTIWVYGPSFQVPTMEHQQRRPHADYGKQKVAIENYLMNQSRIHGFPATVIHPGHIVGPGWAPVNPAGNMNPKLFGKFARGERIYLPELGMTTVHHVHADDVAQCFVQAMNHWNVAVGESFNAVSPSALTMRGYAHAVSSWYGREADLEYLPWEHWKLTVNEDEDWKYTRNHMIHSPNCSIEKAKHLLGYKPRYTSLEAVKESVIWLTENGQI